MNVAILPETRQKIKNMTAACRTELEAAWNALVAEYDQMEQEARERKEAEAYEQRIVEAIKTWDTSKKPLGSFEEEVHRRTKSIELREETRKRTCRDYRFQEVLRACIDSGEIPLNSCHEAAAEFVRMKVNRIMIEEATSRLKPESKPVYKTGGHYNRSK